MSDGSEALVRLAGDGEVADIVERVHGFLLEAPGALCVPTLCNRLWFGEEYAAAPISEIPIAAHSFPAGHPRLAPQAALALGAIVTIETGSDIAFGEVVWKEGAHLALSEDWVPGWLSGAPAVPDSLQTPPADYVEEPGAARVLRERVVLDFSCFGAAVDLPQARFERMRDRSYRLDRWGHLVMDAFYPEGAEDDDLSFWADWVAATCPEATAVLGVGEQGLGRAALRLADALGARDDVRGFGPYFIASETYERLVAEDAKQSQSFARTARSLALTPRGQDRAWSSMSVRLREFRPEEMVGAAWATSVVAASLYVLDVLAEEAPTGDWNGVHLRLDDDWQGGGLWRAEVLGAHGPIAADPALALGLGWTEHTGGDVELGEDLTPEELVESPECLAEEEEYELSPSEAVWRLHLTAHDIDVDRLRVPQRIATLLAGTLEIRAQDRVAVRLSHDGEAQQTLWTRMTEGGSVEVAWPLGILPGTTVTASWSIGTPAIALATRRLAEPVEVGGVLYRHEFNEQVALAALGLLEAPPRVVTLSTLVAAAVRRGGAITEDGRRAMGFDEIAERCFGPAGEVAPTYRAGVLRRAVVDAARRLVRAGQGEIRGALLLLDEAGPGGRGADKELLRRYLDRTNQRLRREVAKHWRSSGIVNLPEGWHASPEKRAEWESVAGTSGLPDVELGEHQTWRKGHIAGGRLPPGVEAELQRAAAVAARMLGNEIAPSQGSASGPDGDARSSYATANTTPMARMSAEQRAVKDDTDG